MRLIPSSRRESEQLAYWLHAQLRKLIVLRQAYVNGVTTKVDVGRHRMEATVFGSGLPVVVIEPALGGYARAWWPIAQALAEDTTVVTYDRAPYGASSPARDGRMPRDVAADLHGVLRSLDITGPLVLVGHSLGGIYIRTYAALHMEQVAGMVLVDSSHEAQRRVLRSRFSPKDRLLVALTVPQMIVRSKQWRGGGDRRSIIREYRMFKRLTAADQALARGELGERPLLVVTRGPGKAEVAPLWQAWCDLQRDLAQLSVNSRLVVSESPNHYLQDGDPELITTAICEVVRSVRTKAPLAELAAASDGE
jgi:pimeloyl-ACP methyl ester carboxylesterase